MAEAGMSSPFILFRNDKSGETLVFADPVEIVTATSGDEIQPALARLEQARQAGYWLAGALSYEAGFVFEDKLKPLIPNGRPTPLVQFGIFAAPAGPDHRLAQPLQETSLPTQLEDPRATWDVDAYRQRFEILHQHLRQGDCYQANLTMPVEASYRGNACTLFWSLIERQPVSYGALVSLGGQAIVSRSPELFFKVDEAGFIETHPMKGTAARGRDAAEDEAIKAAMLADEKTQAENRMIVDLLRNDLSRIIETGSLSVPKLFAIETYPTLHQLVSHVRGKLLPGIGLPAILEALFPCGSITGAPKLAAMQILHKLEAGPRDVYCGAIGFCDPAGPMRFSVAIRTLTLFGQEGTSEHNCEAEGLSKSVRAVFNVGGGIVFDSQPGPEFEECLLKARFAVGDRWISR
ncbi:aminodeoxychorismate synthase component I [Allorhizobium taibaishanense]|uniref:Aminodeoxychorismate synthase, component I n=1 Tax=Allorhizobium taibaishanense TaxID=887144 RepID=A0A1Q9A543_9HYPH|nr:aminodeoxychorismate synthase component I [Allorhizobium taibaishanense]MBB4006702.1 para-aminobenzoate synthetase component 1 [Allorhizobium taibaishanense]OLP49607.1 aminodeoxychorismate synthase, component I [Allorhizobium taibaishanense]